MCLGILIFVAGNALEIKNNEKYEIKELSDYFSDLRLLKGMEKSKAIQYRKVYRGEVELGKDYKYARYYTILRVEGNISERKSRKAVELYYRNIQGGKSENYSMYYSSAVVVLGLSKEQATIEAEKFDKYIIKTDKSNRYLYYYIISMIKGDKDFISKTQAEAEETLDKDDGYEDIYEILELYDDF